ncbi:MAG TPA: hypothetical protein VGO20_10540, partial [Arenibaculum sp.]|nr:hypothetical protein [Arenibaculum sp.]
MPKPPPPTRYGRNHPGPAQPRANAPPHAVQARPAGAAGPQRVHAPPPTRFAQPPAVQQRTAPSAAPARSHAPPPTRFAQPPAAQAKAQPGRLQPPQHCPHCSPGRGRAIQMMDGIEYFGGQVEDKVGNGINYGGQSLGPVVVRQPRSFDGEEEAKFLRNLSTFLWHIGEMILTKPDAEVESMYVNDRIVISANNPGTMKEIYDYILTNKEFNDFVRTSIDTGSDKRGQRTVDRVSDQLMGPDTSVESRLILQSMMVEKTKEYVKLATIRNKGLSTDVLTSRDYSGKLILIKGLPIHAEQKL